MEEPTKKPEQVPSPQSAAANDLAAQAAILKAIQGNTLPQSQMAASGGGYNIELPASYGLLDFIFNRQDFRKHQEMMNYLRHVTVETMEAMNAASALTVDYVANSLETESAIEKLIMSYKDSPMAVAVAPTYAQIAHMMQMQTVTGIAQAGMNRIKGKIERR